MFVSRNNANGVFLIIFLFQSSKKNCSHFCFYFSVWSDSNNLCRRANNIYQITAFLIKKKNCSNFINSLHKVYIHLLFLNSNFVHFVPFTIFKFLFFIFHFFCSLFVLYYFFLLFDLVFSVCFVSRYEILNAHQRIQFMKVQKIPSTCTFAWLIRVGDIIFSGGSRNVTVKLVALALLTSQSNFEPGPNAAPQYFLTRKCHDDIFCSFFQWRFAQYLNLSNLLFS